MNWRIRTACLFLASLLPLSTLLSCGVSGGYASTGTQRTYTFALVSNFGGNTISAFYLASDGGLVQSATTLSVAGASNPSSLAINQSNSWVYATMQNSNHVASFTVDNMDTSYPSTVTPFASEPLTDVGSSPRSMVVAPSEAFAYVVSSNLASNNVHVLAIDPVSGALSAQSTVSADLNPSSLAISPAGDFLFVANSGSSNVTVFSIAAETGALTEIGASPYNVASNPEQIALDPTGQMLAVVNTGSNSVTTFTVDSSTGELTLVGATPVGTAPQQIAFHPDGTFAYVTNEDSDDISVFGVTAATGTLAEITGSPFALAGQSGPYAVAIEPAGEYLLTTWGGSGSLAVFSIGTDGTPTAVGSPVATGSSPRWVQPFSYTVIE